MRSAKLMRLALICQDMADGLMAVNDITGAGPPTWMNNAAQLQSRRRNGPV
jgi:hypothetical protein